VNVVAEVKEIADLVKKVGDIELYRRIVNLESEVMELTRRNRELEEAISVAKEMRFKKPFWYADGEGDPYCPACWEGPKIRSHLLPPHPDYNSNDSYVCPQCSRRYVPATGAVSMSPQGRFRSV
jgi:hypothetical protein